MSRTRLRRFLDRTVSGEATNLIAEGMVVEGQIKGIGHLIVAGRVKGDCKIAGTVTLTQTGSWRGKIEAERVLLAGQLDGSAKAGDKLEVAASARINGDVSGKTIAVAEGAVIEGEMQVVSGEAAVRFEEKRASGSTLPG